jgi:site-specific DNA-methyltransferase (adenine-specific)
MKLTEKLEITNEDNMELMARYPDNYFELAIVDPPYQLDKSSMTGSGKLKNRIIQKNTDWDVAPKKEYFNELFRVSQNQIIWGGNYFELPKYRCVIVWDKCQPWQNFSQVEIAWTSFNKPARIFKFDNRTGDKIHPTQKPCKLYEFLLMNYAKEDDKILDTHLGSGSLAIACHNLGFELTACELDEDYYNASIKRIQNHINQLRIF